MTHNSYIILGRVVTIVFTLTGLASFAGLIHSVQNENKIIVAIQALLCFALNIASITMVNKNAHFWKKELSK